MEPSERHFGYLQWQFVRSTGDGSIGRAARESENPGNGHPESHPGTKFVGVRGGPYGESPGHCPEWPAECARRQRGGPGRGGTGPARPFSFRSCSRAAALVLTFPLGPAPRSGCSERGRTRDRPADHRRVRAPGPPLAQSAAAVRRDEPAAACPRRPGRRLPLVLAGPARPGLARRPAAPDRSRSARPHAAHHLRAPDRRPDRRVRRPAVRVLRRPGGPARRRQRRAAVSALSRRNQQ